MRMGIQVCHFRKVAKITTSQLSFKATLSIFRNDLWILIDEIFIPSVGDHSVQGSILLATSLHEFNDRLVWMWSVDKVSIK